MNFWESHQRSSIFSSSNVWQADSKVFSWFVAIKTLFCNLLQWESIKEWFGLRDGDKMCSWWINLLTEYYYYFMLYISEKNITLKMSPSLFTYNKLLPPWRTVAPTVNLWHAAHHQKVCRACEAGRPLFLWSLWKQFFLSVIVLLSLSNKPSAPLTESRLTLWNHKVNCFSAPVDWLSDGWRSTPVTLSVCRVRTGLPAFSHVLVCSCSWRLQPACPSVCPTLISHKTPRAEYKVMDELKSFEKHACELDLLMLMILHKQNLHPVVHHGKWGF